MKECWLLLNYCGFCLGWARIGLGEDHYECLSIGEYKWLGINECINLAFEMVLYTKELLEPNWKFVKSFKN
jgi:hypothetical protein